MEKLWVHHWPRMQETFVALHHAVATQWAPSRSLHCHWLTHSLTWNGISTGCLDWKWNWRKFAGAPEKTTTFIYYIHFFIQLWSETTTYISGMDDDADEDTINVLSQAWRKSAKPTHPSLSVDFLAQEIVLLHRQRVRLTLFSVTQRRRW